MRKLVTAALSALLLGAVAAPALAQPYGASGGDRRYDHRDRYDRRHDRGYRYDRDHWDRWSPPVYWRRSHDGWRSHVRACMATYRSYDPRSDTYIGHDGFRHRCRL